MCGIVGLVGPPRPQSAQWLDLMSRCVAHRGLDRAGTWVDERAGVHLGHQRLSIIDLTDTGNQPMTSASGRYVIAFNGEIYDFQDHRQRLVDAGVMFRGRSDTEVLLALFEVHGVVKALTIVDGAFAFALWDRADGELVLARDRLGEKPLFYGQVDGLLAFASELTAIEALPGAPRGVDPAALAGYLEQGFVPGSASIMPGVSKVPPGTVVRWTHTVGLGDPEHYWDLTDAARRGLGDPISDPATAAEELERLLSDSIRRRLISDVPLGAFLSGGVDSTTIAALAQSVSGTPLRTFTVAVGGAGDESRYAARIAAHLGTAHETLELPDLDPLELARRAIDIHDEPFADPSSIPMSLVCSAARQRVTVCLSGDGGDELFAGYNRHRVAVGSLARAQQVPRPVRGAVAAGMLAVRPESWNRLARILRRPTVDVGTKAHKLAGVLAAPTLTDAYDSLARQWDPDEVLVDAPELREQHGAVELPGATPLDHVLLREQGGLLPDDMLVKGDRTSMATGLELRLPLLDHHIVEFSWRLPAELKFRGGRGKWPLRQILDHHVPSELWDRPKTGFDPPLADWLRGPLREWAQDLLSPAALRSEGLLRPEPIALALDQHLSGARNNDYKLWTVLMLQGWLEKRDRT